MTDIPVNQFSLDGREREYVLDCLDTGWISSEGPYVERFERAMAACAGRRFGVAVTNGSVALDLAIASLGLQPGDEVIVPTFTIISCVAAIVRGGGTPVLVDADPLTWNMTPQAVERQITSRTRAIMLVHIYGLPVDADPILKVAERHGIDVVEDAAEMHGQTYNGRPCGSLGRLSTFSFYPNKHVTTGEGGMIVTDDELLAEHLRRMRNLAFSGPRRFVHQELGVNARMSNIQAAIGLAQVERLPETVDKKRAIGRAYRDALLPAARERFDLQLDRTSYAENIYWVVGVVLADHLSVQTADLCASLANSGVGTRPFFWCMHEQPVFKKMGLFLSDAFPVAERLARRGFYLPSGAGTALSDVRTAADRLITCLDAVQ